MVVSMSNQIPEEVIEEVRKSNDIVDVVGEYVQLKKQGKSFFGLCPFHGENTPSFSVAQDKQIFRCFGCGKGGNVITFMREIESFSFFESLKFLADRTGVELPVTERGENTSYSKENNDILSAYEWLTKLYHHLIRHSKEGKEGYQYLKDRGISQEAIDDFQLGYAPNLPDFTAKFLEKKGFHQQLLVKAGLITMREDHSVTDRFRGRVIFPIRNHLGKTIGFGGRALTDDGPKYLNSSESELFQKGKLLYNFDLAKRHIRKSNEVILYEGYMDVISSYQAGIKNAIATLGTALTEIQAKLLKRYVDTVVICFDSDNAGIEAAYKASVLLRKTGCDVKIATVKEGLDPDDYINKYGGDDFKEKIIQASETFIGFLMRYNKRNFNLGLEGDRIKYVELMIQDLALIESQIEREYYLRELSNEFNLSMSTLEEELDRFRSIHRKQGAQQNQTKSVRQKPMNFFQANPLRPAFQNAERKLLAYMLNNRSITDKVREEIGASFNIDEHKIIATHLYAYYEAGHPEDVALFIEKLTEEKLRNLVTELAMIPISEDVSHKEINDYLKLIHSETNEKETIKSLKEQQKVAEQQNDAKKAAEIGVQIINLQKHSRQLN